MCGRIGLDLILLKDLSCPGNVIIPRVFMYDELITVVSTFGRDADVMLWEFVVSLLFCSSCFILLGYLRGNGDLMFSGSLSSWLSAMNVSFSWGAIFGCSLGFLLFLSLQVDRG